MSMSPLRILYVGPLGKGSTTLQRLHSLQYLGYECVSFDMNPYYRYGSRIRRSIVHRLAFGKQVDALNQGLCQFAKGTDYDWVWIDKGIWVYPETVEFLKRNNALIIHYTPDPAIVFHKTRHFADSIPKYDVLITTKKYEIEKYKEYGAKNVIFVHQGYDPNIFKPYEVERELARKLESDVCFVGHTEPHYYYRLKAVSHVVNNLAVWGEQWPRKTLFHPWLKKAYRGGGIWHIEYAKAICCAKIGLGFLSKLAPEQSTTRTFEIPACGTFLLAERTNEHLELFEEGKEAEFFSSDEELIDKVKYYLAHDDERKQIAAAGRARCIKSSYSNHDRLKEAIDKIMSLRKL